MRKQTKCNQSLKILLMLQSLSPLAVLTIVRNFPFQLLKQDTFSLSSLFGKLCTYSTILTVVMLVCLIWIIIAFITWLPFASFIWVDKTQGYEIMEVVEEEDAGLIFFLTVILPVLLDDVNELNGALILLAIVLMIFVLMWRTDLLYANPVLAMLGYRVYKFSFKENSQYQHPCIGICRKRISNISDPNCINYKPITESVFYIEEQNR